MRHSKLQLLLLFLCLLPLIIGCSKKRSYLKEGKLYGLSYGKDSSYLMDVYLPGRRDRTTPFILLIHGGGWTKGSKTDMNFVQEELLQRGIASASMNYRYASAQVHYPDMMQDVHMALRYCRKMQDKWTITEDKYLIGGFSAGAHMSLLYAYAYDTARQIAAVISAVGPTDLCQPDFLENAARIELLPGVELVTGATYRQGKPLDEQFRLASPRTFIRPVPTLLIHGNRDQTVPYSQSQLLSQDLAAAGIPQKLVTLEGAPHNMNLADSAYKLRVMSEMADWCLRYGR